MPTIVAPVYQDRRRPRREVVTQGTKDVSMLSSRGYQRPAWENRFNRPTLRMLKQGLDPFSAKLFDSLHDQLSTMDGVSVGFAWHGECWRWTVEYRTGHSDDPLAVIVPSPENLQLAVPLDRDFACSISTRRMTRALKDGLGLAQEPFDTRWGVWPIPAAGLLEDVLDLVEMKLRHLAKQAG